jgi:hypothetical protein
MKGSSEKRKKNEDRKIKICKSVKEECTVRNRLYNYKRNSTVFFNAKIKVWASHMLSKYSTIE